MAKIFLPRIQQADYDEFRRMVISLPAAYSDWLHQQDKDIQSCGRGADEVELVDIDSAEFRQYCARARVRSELGTLSTFAELRGTGRL